MLPLTARGLIRFDVEDFLTAASDDALLYMVAAMRRQGMPGSYGLVGKKVWALGERGREDILKELRQERSLGFHSTSHSEHPTIAEELAPLDYPAAVHRFLERERPGVVAVSQAVGAPRYFTQPGANWVPEAAEALPQLGMDLYFTDSFNSYVVDLTAPYWYGEVLLLSFPVVNPRPFGLGLPGNLKQAIEFIESWEGKPGTFMVMLHPTELVTYEFWDAVNFAHGRTREVLVPGPVRTALEQRQALESFASYLQEIRHKNIEWCDAQTIREMVEPRRPVKVSRRELEHAIYAHGVGPVQVRDGFLSAAEALYALVKLSASPAEGQVAVSYVGAPSNWRADDGEKPAITGDRLRVFSRAVVEAVETTGRLPSGPIGGVSLEQGMWALLGRRDVRNGPPSFLRYIKDPDDLHWDWPIFPEQFRPMRLWQDARRLAWTLKPAALKLDDETIADFGGRGR